MMKESKIKFDHSIGYKVMDHVGSKIVVTHPDESFPEPTEKHAFVPLTDVTRNSLGLPIGYKAFKIHQKRIGALGPGSRVKYKAARHIWNSDIKQFANKSGVVVARPKPDPEKNVTNIENFWVIRVVGDDGVSYLANTHTDFIIEEPGIFALPPEPEEQKWHKRMYAEARKRSSLAKKRERYEGGQEGSTTRPSPPSSSGTADLLKNAQQHLVAALNTNPEFHLSREVYQENMHLLVNQLCLFVNTYLFKATPYELIRIYGVEPDVFSRVSKTRFMPKDREDFDFSVLMPPNPIIIEIFTPKEPLMFSEWYHDTKHGFAAFSKFFKRFWEIRTNIMTLEDWLDTGTNAERTYKYFLTWWKANSNLEIVTRMGNTKEEQISKLKLLFMNQYGENRFTLSEPLFQDHIPFINNDFYRIFVSCYPDPLDPSSGVPVLQREDFDSHMIRQLNEIFTDPKFGNWNPVTGEFKDPLTFPNSERNREILRFQTFFDLAADRVYSPTQTPDFKRVSRLLNTPFFQQIWGLLLISQRLYFLVFPSRIVREGASAFVYQRKAKVLSRRGLPPDPATIKREENEKKKGVRTENASSGSPIYEITQMILDHMVPPQKHYSMGVYWFFGTKHGRYSKSPAALVLAGEELAKIVGTPEQSQSIPLPLTSTSSPPPSPPYSPDQPTTLPLPQTFPSSPQVPVDPLSIIHTFAQSFNPYYDPGSVSPSPQSSPVRPSSTLEASNTGNQDAVANWLAGIMQRPKSRHKPPPPQTPTSSSSDYSTIYTTEAPPLTPSPSPLREEYEVSPPSQMPYLLENSPSPLEIPFSPGSSIAQLQEAQSPSSFDLFGPLTWGEEDEDLVPDESSSSQPLLTYLSSWDPVSGTFIE
jgi:hypothetical protein